MKRFASGVFAVLWLTTAHAEQMYVSDKLVVGVFADENSEASKLATLETGDAVEILERQDKYFRVRLDDGREGWVRATYLTKQAPAIVRLKELQTAGAVAAQPNPQLAEELAKLKEQNAALRAERDALKSAPPQALPAPAVVAPPVEKTIAMNSADGIAIEAPHSLQKPLLYGVGVLLGGGLLGFYCGYQTLAARIRRKYGSVRIY